MFVGPLLSCELLTGFIPRLTGFFSVAFMDLYFRTSKLTADIDVDCLHYHQVQLFEFLEKYCQIPDYASHVHL